MILSRRMTRHRRLALEPLEQRTLLAADLSLAVDSVMGRDIQPVLTVAGGDPADYEVNNPTVDPELDGVVRLIIERTDGTFSCSGSLISPQHVLTAAHCFVKIGLVSGQMTTENAEVRFELAPSTTEVRSAAEIYVFPGWGGGLFSFLAGGDLAVAELESAAPVEADVYELYRGSDELGQTIEKVGYGLSGTGETGAVPGTAGVKRAGLNEADFIYRQRQIWYDFDSGASSENVFGSTGLGDDEIGVARGDSGGPLFLRHPVTNERQLAGVSSYALPTFKDIDFFAESSFGEISADTRVSRFVGWIDDVIAGTVESTGFGERFFGGLRLRPASLMPVSENSATGSFIALDTGLPPAQAVTEHWPIDVPEHSYFIGSMSASVGQPDPTSAQAERSAPATAGRPGLRSLHEVFATSGEDEWLLIDVLLCGGPTSRAAAHVLVD